MSFRLRTVRPAVKETSRSTVSPLLYSNPTWSKTMSQPSLVRVLEPVCTGQSSISFMRAILVLVEMMAARFCSALCNGS